MIEQDINIFFKNIDNKQKYIFFLSPNYEDRSIGLFDCILKMPDEKNFLVVVLKLQSKNYKVDILDDIKQNKYRLVINKLNENKINFNEVEISYPDRYNIMSIDNLYIDFIDNNNYNILFDFSCLPKTIIIDICSVFMKKINGQKFYFAYSSAKNYPKIRYPQAIGELKGIISNKPLSLLLEQYNEGTLFNFPGDMGYSGQSISDQTSRHSGFDQYLFIYMRRKHPHQSFEAMSGNIHLLGEAYREWRNNIINHFSIQDGFRKLEDIVNMLCNSASPNDHLVLFAPFGPKPLVVGCYLMLKKLEKLGFKSEIIQESSFQYSSVYSLGIERTYLFHIND